MKKIPLFKIFFFLGEKAGDYTGGQLSSVRRFFHLLY
jgi:hypothetical protein